jgi:hypothetical protein
MNTITVEDEWKSAISMRRNRDLAHYGRSWKGSAPEDVCPCPQEPCGLVAVPNKDCEQHGMMAAKTIRQNHRGIDCPGRPT